MPIDGIVFTALIQELDHHLTNGRIQNVFQPKVDEVVFHIRQPGETFRLFGSVHPQLARLHLTDTSKENPIAPPPFCLLLRKQLIPGRILGFSQPPMERYVTMRVESLSAAGERRELHVIFEVMGRHSNIIVVDAQTEIIMDSLKRIPATANSYREMLPHRSYTPPPPQAKQSPWTMTFDEFDRFIRHWPATEPINKAIQQRVAGFSPFAARELLAHAALPPDIQRQDITTEQIQHLWNALTKLLQNLKNGRLKPTFVEGSSYTEFWCFAPQTIAGEQRTFPSVNALLDYVYTKRSDSMEIKQAKNRLATVVAQRLGRVERKMHHQEEAVQKSGRSEQLKRYGDLITANLYRWDAKPFHTERIVVEDYFADGKIIEIPVNPALTPSQNAQQYFKRYQKARKTAQKAREQWQASRNEKAYLESIQVALDSAQSIQSLREIELELQRQGYIATPRDTKNRGKHPRDVPAAEPMKFVSGDGFTILVGRNNRQNDEITLRRSRPNDLWLHTKEIPGAHVVIQTNNQEVPERTLLEAGQLAVHHSKAKMSGNVPVDYTFCKYVRKPKGAKPGMVLYDHEKTLWITPDAQLIDRLTHA